MAQSQITPLPPAGFDQTYVSVSAIEGGFITLPDHCFIAPSNPTDFRSVPSLAFLIQHPGASIFSLKSNGSASQSSRIMFDLGLRAHLNRYVPKQQAHLVHRQPYRLGPGVTQRLLDGGISPAEIDAVFLSHVHYDHHGDPEDFDHSTFVVGPGSLEILAKGLPGLSASHQVFDPKLLPKERTVELPRVGGDSTRTALPNGTSVEWQWEPLGPFPAALDIFGDSSVYAVDSPGHLPGHIFLLCRTGPGKWLLLGGDACHDMRLLTGEKEIGMWKNDHGIEMCIHIDRKGAEKAIEGIRKVMNWEGQDTEVVLAHDSEWFRDNSHRMFPKTL